MLHLMHAAAATTTVAASHAMAYDQKICCQITFYLINKV